MTLPFPVTFYGTTYPSLWINSNGNATLNGPNPSALHTNVPDGALALLAPLYGNFNPAASPSSDVYYNVVGTAPNRVVLVTWRIVPEFGGSPVSTFQLQLHEADGAIIFT